jgi:hypothetical protein
MPSPQIQDTDGSPIPSEDIGSLLPQTATAPWVEDKWEQGVGSVMGNRVHCDLRHNGLSKTDTMPDNEDFSDLIAANNRLLLIFSRALMLRLAT